MKFFSFTKRQIPFLVWLALHKIHMSKTITISDDGWICIFFLFFLSSFHSIIHSFCYISVGPKRWLDTCFSVRLRAMQSIEKKNEFKKYINESAENGMSLRVDRKEETKKNKHASIKLDFIYFFFALNHFVCFISIQWDFLPFLFLRSLHSFRMARFFVFLPISTALSPPLSLSLSFSAKQN